eukprot:FR739070.1.p1 GENE.FR739070.1~~FR739070.1.p1  ORF type:complete len:189 (+),score=25.91 FR739070.1:525-1091(+)
MERLVQYKRMVKDFNNTEWGDASNTTTYCTVGKSDLFAEKYSGKNFSTDSAFGSDCLGHHAEDMTMFRSMIKDPTTGTYVYRATTNIEVFRMIYPAEYMASYIYENFEWEQCEGRYSFLSIDWKKPDRAFPSPTLPTLVILTNSSTLEKMNRQGTPMDTPIFWLFFLVQKKSPKFAPLGVSPVYLPLF